MNASTVKELFNKGFRVSVTKPDGTIEKYHPLKNGDVAVTYSGPSICIYCGRVSRGNCSCPEEIETISRQGAFRHINDIAKKNEASVDDVKRLLTITQESWVN